MNLSRRIVWAFAALLLVSTVALAQGSKHESHLRTVRGVTVIKDDSPVSGAVVFLKNMRTQAVQSRISDDAGAFRFSGLDPNADYEIHAVKDDSQSATRTISSFDSRKEIVITLKLDRKRS